MSYMRGRRGTRSLPSSWWPRPWPTPRRAARCRPRPGCRADWRSCWPPGRGAAPMAPARCWPGWRSRADRWPRTGWPRLPGWMRRRCAAGCGSWPRPGCSPRTPPGGSTGSGTRCWPRRWPSGCCPASGPRCMSPWRGRWQRPATTEPPRRWPGTGRPPGILPGSCRPGWRRPRPPSGYSATPKPRRTGSGPSSWARRCLARPTRTASACRGCMSGPSTRSIGLAPGCEPGGSPRRPTCGSPLTPTPRSPRPSATAPDGGGRPARRTPGSP
jgi:hypothetical protein